MKINFRQERFSQLLEEAKAKGLSIPRLIDEILESHYTSSSHEGVQDGTEERGGGNSSIRQSSC